MKATGSTLHQKSSLGHEVVFPLQTPPVLENLGSATSKVRKRSLKTHSKIKQAVLNDSGKQSINLHDFLSSRGSTISQLVNDRNVANKVVGRKHFLKKSRSSSKKLNHSSTPAESVHLNMKSGSKSNSPDGSSQAGSSQEKKLPPKGPRTNKVVANGNMFQSYHHSQDLEDNYQMKPSLLVGNESTIRNNSKPRKANSSRKETELGVKYFSNPTKALDNQSPSATGYSSAQERVQFGNIRECLASRQIRKPKIRLHDLKSRDALSFDSRPNMHNLDEVKECEPNVSRLSSVKSSALNSVCYLPSSSSPHNLYKREIGDDRADNYKGHSSQNKQLSKYFGEVFGQMFNFRKKQKNHMSFAGYSVNESDISRAALSKKKVPNLLSILTTNQFGVPRAVASNNISQLKTKKSNTMVVPMSKLSQMSTRKASPNKSSQEFQDPYCLASNVHKSQHERVPASQRLSSTSWGMPYTPGVGVRRSGAKSRLDAKHSRASSAGAEGLGRLQSGSTSAHPASKRGKSPQTQIRELESAKEKPMFYVQPKIEDGSRRNSIKQVRAEKRHRSSSLKSENQKLMFRPKSGVINPTEQVPNKSPAINRTHFSGRNMDKAPNWKIENEDQFHNKPKKHNPFLECIRDITLPLRKRNLGSVDDRHPKIHSVRPPSQHNTVYSILQDQQLKLPHPTNHPRIPGRTQIRQGSLPSQVQINKHSSGDTSRHTLGRKKSAQPASTRPPKPSQNPSISQTQKHRKASRRVSPSPDAKPFSPATGGTKKQKKQKPARVVIGDSVPQPNKPPREHTEFSYKKNVNGVFISSSFLLDNEMLEADLSKSLGNVWSGGNFGPGKQNQTEESSSPDKGAEFKIHEIMANLDPNSPESISSKWTDVLYVLKQDYLRLSYLNSFENVLRMMHTIVTFWEDFKDLSFQSLNFKGKKLFSQTIQAPNTASKSANGQSKFRNGKYDNSADENLIDLETDLNFGANQLHNRLELGIENLPVYDSADEKELSLDTDLKHLTVVSVEPQVTNSKFFENQRSTTSQEPQVNRPEGSLKGTGKTANIQDSTQGRLSSASQELEDHLKATQSLQESTKIKTGKLRDKHQTHFFMICLKTFFMTVDEQLVLENPIFSDIVRMFQTVVVKVCSMESMALTPAINAFERLLAKLRDSSYRIKNEDFSVIVDTLASLLEIKLKLKSSGQDSLQRTGFGNVLSEPKLDIIECVDKNVQINVGVSLKVIQDLAKIGPCLFNVLDSRVTSEHAKIAAIRLSPFVQSMLTFDQTENIDYLVQACQLLSVVVQTSKVYEHIKLQVDIFSHLFAALLQVLIGSSRLAVIRKHKSMYPTLVSLKKYFQVTIHNLWEKSSEVQTQDPRGSRIRGLFPHKVHSKLPLMDFKVFHGLQELVTDIFLNIFIDPIDIKQENHYVEVFYVLFDVLIEFSCFCKETSAPFFSDMVEPLRKLALDFMTALDSVDKSGPQGKIAEEVLLLIWKVGEITN